MSDFHALESFVVEQRIDANSTTEKHPLGMITRAQDTASTATDGTVDDAVVTGDRVHHALGASAVGTPSTGLADFEIQRPFVNDAQTN